MIEPTNTPAPARAESNLPVPQCFYRVADTDPSFSIDLTPEEESVDLLDYWRVVVKRRWIIVTCVLVTVALTAIAMWRTVPLYQATARIQVDPDQPDVLPFKTTDGPTATYALSQEYLQTQFKVLVSRTLARRVIHTLKLDRNPAFLASGATRPSRWWWKSSSRSTDNIAPPVTEDEQLKHSVDFFLENLSASPIRNSRVVDVSFVARNPKLAAEVANTVADEYIQMNFETRYRASIAASDFIAKQLVDLKSRVEKSQEELVRFSQEHNIYALSEKENVIIQKLSDLNAALTAAETDRMQKEALWEEVRGARIGEFPEVLRNQVIKDLETSLAVLKQQYARLQASFKPGWPELDQLEGQIGEAEKQLGMQQQKAVRSVEGEYRAALRRQKLLREALEEQKRESAEYNQNSIHYSILKRQVDTDKQVYEGLLQRMKEAGVSAGLHSNNIHAIDPAEVPSKPYKPDPVLNLSLALALGIMTGLGLAFFTEYLDRSLRTPDDVARYIKLPSLGIIPIHSAPALPAGHKLLSATAQERPDLDTGSVELITHCNARSIISEAYRNLRTSILLSANNGHPPKLLLVTSSQQGEGKTTTAINVATTLAQTGNSVMLLDCDMRNPRVHRALNLANENGMSNYLSGNASLSAVVQVSAIPNLSVVTSGPIPPNPAELIGSPRMKEGLSLLERSVNFVVIDTPPVLSVTDARILGTQVDGVILVVKGGATPREAVRQTKRLLEGVNARIIGTLLNNVDLHSGDYYSKYYYYGYGRGKKGYGYGRKSQNA
jgi:polysaccharide biosynthesis transport protein